MACRAASPGAAEDPKLQEVRPPPVGTDSLRKVTKLGRERARLRPELAGADWVNPRLPAAGQRGKAGKYVARTRPRSMRPNAHRAAHQRWTARTRHQPKDVTSSGATDLAARPGWCGRDAPP